MSVNPYPLPKEDSLDLPILSRSSCRARSLREVELEKSATCKGSRSPALTWSHGIPSMIGGQYGGGEGKVVGSRGRNLVKWAGIDRMLS